MVYPLNRENEVYEAVLRGELAIDPRGQVWRTADRRGQRWSGGSRLIPCEPRRAENDTGKYLQVRVMYEGHRAHALAHRLVWRHFNGPIPEGLTINHKNGRHAENWPGNLELATYQEQAIHARQVLRRGRLDQNGPRNAMAKLTTEQVQEICSCRASGERLAVIAADYGVVMQTISRIARGDRRSLG
jgi:hypothetical protein